MDIGILGTSYSLFTDITDALNEPGDADRQLQNQACKSLDDCSATYGDSDTETESDISDPYPPRASTRLGFRCTEIKQSFSEGDVGLDDVALKDQKNAYQLEQIHLTSRNPSDTLHTVPADHLVAPSEDDDDDDDDTSLRVDLSFCISRSPDFDNDSISSYEESDDEQANSSVLAHLDSFPAPSPDFIEPISFRPPLPPRPSQSPLLSCLLSLTLCHDDIEPEIESDTQLEMDAETSTPPASPPPTAMLIHHGPSKSALNHLKWFWSARFDEWIVWEAQLEDGEEDVSDVDDAYSGIAVHSEHAAPSPPPPWRSSLSRDTTSPSPTPPTPAIPLSFKQNPNANIFPRIGDISALRDPYAMNIDKCFCHFPLWTMHKTLYMFDMHHRALSMASESSSLGGNGEGTSPPKAEANAEPKTDIENETLMTDNSDEMNASEEAPDSAIDSELRREGLGSLSAGSSDSDVTLVSDITSCLGPPPAGKSKVEFQVVAASSSNVRILLDHEDGEQDEEEGDSYTWEGVRAWEISWYARWELLIELVKRDEATRAQLDSTKPFPNPSSSPRTRPALALPAFFLEGGDYEGDGDDDVWDDGGDDEEYGMIIENPVYRRPVEAGDSLVSGLSINAGGSRRLGF